jgi:hypothetical protein
MRPTSKTLAFLALGIIVGVTQGLATAPDVQFSGDLEILEGWDPSATGIYESNKWILHIVTYTASASVALDTTACMLMRIGYNDPYWEIPTEWRVCDSREGAVIDSGWLAVATFMEMFQDNPIVVPSGWSGEIYFQVRMTRYGLGHSAGDYSAALTVIVTEPQ